MVTVIPSWATCWWGRSNTSESNAITAGQGIDNTIVNGRVALVHAIAKLTDNRKAQRHWVMAMLGPGGNLIADNADTFVYGARIPAMYGLAKGLLVGLDTGSPTAATAAFFTSFAPNVGLALSAFSFSSDLEGSFAGSTNAMINRYIIMQLMIAVAAGGAGSMMEHLDNTPSFYD